MSGDYSNRPPGGAVTPGLGQPTEPAARLGWRSYAAAALAFAVLIGLGTWQVQRLHWKEALIARIEERRHAAPVALAEIEREFQATGDIDYIPVKVTGSFRHDAETYFFTTWQGASGFDVFTPLILGDGRTILVNRGFVPYELKEPARRAAGQVAGETTITGLARTAPAAKPSMMLPDNDPSKNIFYWKDLPAMAARAGVSGPGLLPFLIDADGAPNPGGLPQGGATIVDLPNSHLQYAVTWYGLALALVGVFGALALRRKGDSPS